MLQPKWLNSDRNSKVGDVVLFPKSDKEFNKHYHYGIISKTKISRDGKIREIEIEYHNHDGNKKRRTIKGVRDVVLRHLDKIGMMRELNALSQD